MAGGDLENMLLEAAGCTGASRSNKPSKHRHHGSYSDDGSDSKEDDSNDGLRCAGRKPSGSQVPLKKRSKNRDDDQRSDDDMGHKDGGSGYEGYSTDDSDVGSDLYKDKVDKEELSKMSELEREMILAERAAIKDDRKLHKQMKSRLVGEKKPQFTREASPLASTRGVRSSARYADKVAAKANVLKELKERRMRRDPEGRQRLSNEHSGFKEHSPKKKTGVGAISSGSFSDSQHGSDSHSDDNESIGGGGVDYSDEDRDRHASDIPKFEQIQSITIRRSKLAKWFMEPFFEELIVGCFVRVGIGMKDGRNIYRLCLVQNVDVSDPNKRYQLENRMTHKYLNCVWGNERSAARWQMARVSDSLPAEDEFNEWRREVERTGGRMPHSNQVQEKQEAIEKINSFVYSAETVKQMLQEKKSVSARPLNIAAEKQKLRRELESAEAREDVTEVQRIKERLKELQAVQHSQETNSKSHKLAEMNRKNRAENFRTSTKRAADRNLNPGDADYDPFSRRWTRSRNYYSAKPKDGTTAKEEATGDGSDVNGTDSKGSLAESTANDGLNATKAAQVAAAGAGKLVDTNAPIDQGTESNMLHNFDLPISLSLLERFGGAYGAEAAFLARKQRIEANIGCRVPEDDGRSHRLTLSVGDYKRRRGLL